MNRQRVVIVTFDSAQILVTGSLEVFSTATRLVLPAQYDAELVSVSGGMIWSSSGMQFHTSRINEVHRSADTLMVAGGRDMGTA